MAKTDLNIWDNGIFSMFIVQSNTFERVHSTFSGLKETELSQKYLNFRDWLIGLELKTLPVAFYVGI